MKSMGRMSNACAQGPSRSILLTQEISLYGDLVTTASPNNTILTLKEKKKKKEHSTRFCGRTQQPFVGT